MLSISTDKVGITGMRGRSFALSDEKRFPSLSYFKRCFDSLKVYYDCGQAPITKLLHDTFAAKLGTKVEFAQAVRPENYKLFQLADLICTIKLTESKLTNDERLNYDETRIFRGPRIFKHDILRGIKHKEI